MTDSLMTLLAPFARTEADPRARKVTRRFASAASQIVELAPHSESTRVALRLLGESMAVAISAVLEEI